MTSLILSSMQTIYNITSLITALGSAFLGFLVYLRNRRAGLNRRYLFMSLSISLWAYSLFLWGISSSPQSALLWAKVLHIGASFISITYFHFIVELLGLNKEKKKTVIAGYLAALIITLITPTNLFIQSVEDRFYFKSWPVPGIIYPFFLLLFFFYTVYSFRLVFKALKGASGFYRAQLIYILLGLVVGFGGGATNYFLFYNIRVVPVGNFFVFFYVILYAYAIVRYRLMDIRIAITRTGIFIAVYTLVLGVPFAVVARFRSQLIEVLGSQWWILPLGLMGFLATVGPFIYIFFEHKAEERLLKEQKRYQNTLKQASVGMTRIRNLRKLLDLIAHIVTKTVKIGYVGIYLYNQQSNEYVIQVSRDKGRVPIAKLTPDNTLIKWVVLHRQPIIYEEIKRLIQDTRDPTYQLIADNMQLLTAAVIIPSFLEDRFMGFFVFGDKLSGQIYTPEDLNVFQVLASQAALAIENAQFYEEAKEMQEQIAQAEKMATIGTMADGLSHQINNRFYALSLITGDTLDTIKTTDTSNCTSEVKEMVKQINHALERIQVNVMQGGEVVRGILKYTRRGDASFEGLTLDQIIDGTLEMVQYKVKLSEIDIIRDYPKDTAKVKGNLTQLEEAFFNFIDNAYDAIVERRDLLKEEGYRGRITVSARPYDTMLQITIEDNGMGIKDADMKKVFTPFFTTKVSSRKGTGLGLYVIRRILTDNHKGKIMVESGYKVGTRFIVELPIAQ